MSKTNPSEATSRARALLEEGWTAAFECPQFTPAFVDALIGDQRVTAQHCTCGDPKWLHDVARELQRVETLETALRQDNAFLRAIVDEQGANSHMWLTVEAMKLLEARAALTGEEAHREG